MSIPRVRRAGARLAATVATLAFLPSAATHAADLAFGQYLSSECTTCHRIDGTDRGIPSIVGWPQDQFVAVLQSYKAKERDNPVMQSVASSLGDKEMAALAAYFATLKHAPTPNKGN